MASRKQAGEYEEDLICSICLELFKDTVTLECGHNFCRFCIDSFWDSQEAFSCPECRQAFLDRKYIVNRALTNVAERARTWSLGEKRERANPAQANEIGSDLARRDEGLNLNCAKHNERLKLFCKEDKTPVCDNCFESPKHCGHSFIPLQDAVNLYKDKLIKASSSLETKLKEIMALQMKQEQKIAEIKESGIFLVQHITSEFAALHQFLLEKEQKLLQQFKEEEAGILKEMEEDLRKIKVQSYTIQETISDIQFRLEKQNSLFFLKEFKSLTANLCGDQLQETGCRSRLVTGEISPWLFRGPLQYMVWKEMKSIISPGLSPLTLDLNTAHPYLILSEDLTSVRDSDTKQRPYDNPEIFNYSVSVLGSTGFTSGRHYWEVEVGTKIEWNMGIAKESANRNGQITRTPEQGYWVLWLSNMNEYKALESEPRVLNLSVQPKKIGVYLDYEGGRVSFYNADDMSHIYTFTNNFTEKLYPFFNPGLHQNGTNAEPLKICH